MFGLIRQFLVMQKFNRFKLQQMPPLDVQRFFGMIFALINGVN